MCECEREWLSVSICQRWLTVSLSRVCPASRLMSAGIGSSQNYFPPRLRRCPDWNKCKDFRDFHSQTIYSRNIKNSLLSFQIKLSWKWMRWRMQMWSTWEQTDKWNHKRSEVCIQDFQSRSRVPFNGLLAETNEFICCWRFRKIQSGFPLSGLKVKFDSGAHQP